MQEQLSVEEPVKRRQRQLGKIEGAIRRIEAVAGGFQVEGLIFAGFRKTRHAHAAYNVSRDRAANRGISQLTPETGIMLIL